MIVMIRLHILFIIRPINGESLLFLVSKAPSLFLVMMQVCLLGPQGQGSIVLCWTNPTLLQQSAWLRERETFASCLNSRRLNYSRSMGMGIPSDHHLCSVQRKYALLGVLFEPAFVCSYAAESALQGRKLSALGGRYKVSCRLCSALASGRCTHQSSSERL